MAIKKLYWGMSYRIGGPTGKRVIIHHDGSINPKDLDKLNIDELYSFMKTCATGSIRDALIERITRSDAQAATNPE